MTEELIETYIPDDISIKEFFSLNKKDKIKVIQLGLLFIKEGTNNIQYWNNSEWEEKIINIENFYKEKLEASENQLKDYIKFNDENQSCLIDNIKKTEKEIYKSQIEELHNRNEILTKKFTDLLSEMQYLQTNLDNKWETRLDSTRTFYEKKLTDMQELLYKTQKDCETKINNNIIRNQNSTIKGQDGEEYVFTQLNMTFPRAEIEDTHKIPGRGDFILKEEEFTMMIETKNYSKNVQKSEIDKFYRDIDNPANNDIQCAVFISLNSGICSKNDFEFEIRNKIPILFFHNLQNNFLDLLLAVKFFKLIINQDTIDLSSKEVLDNFKNLASTMKRNFKAQKTKLERYCADQMQLIIDQEANIVNLYQIIKVKF